ncbi:MAG: hypothetical protein ACRD9L_11945 [Bryobacteraceae bacterium]
MLSLTQSAAEPSCRALNCPGPGKPQYRLADEEIPHDFLDIGIRRKRLPERDLAGQVVGVASE